ncbi:MULTISPECIES: cupin domain-containing protein [Spirulina sp. CCY15215]|uniref:cupin domain-containing protein n=1 Tax=Spirulina sp. CCY15215 TaxID=2767591 RepID=UPI00194EE936|nr:cupin domain-containing protein [Spirulina major]
MFVDPQDMPETSGSSYPEVFKSVVAGRYKKRLGNAAGLKNFGVNLVRLEPKSASSVRHWHSKQDEFIYVIKGEITLVTDFGEQVLTSGNAVGFPAGEANGHHLINRSDRDAVYLEIGDRTSGDTVIYPDDDLLAEMGEKGWQFTRKNGEAY